MLTLIYIIIFEHIWSRLRSYSYNTFAVHYWILQVLFKHVYFRQKENLKMIEFHPECPYAAGRESAPVVYRSFSVRPNDDDDEVEDIWICDPRRIYVAPFSRAYPIHNGHTSHQQPAHVRYVTFPIEMTVCMLRSF